MGMTDREKVLHGLSSCGNDYGIPNICEVTECPYRETGVFCVHNLAHDASMLISELLKAQEPIVPIRCSAHAHGSDDVWYECGKCGEFLGVNRYSKQFCAKCGKAVKWE